MALSAGSRLGPCDVLPPLGAGGFWRCRRGGSIGSITLKHCRGFKPRGRHADRRTTLARHAKAFISVLGTRAEGAEHRYAELKAEIASLVRHSRT